jgi:hypothetical protein
MWENLWAGNSFDVVLIVAATGLQCERLRRCFERKSGQNPGFGPPSVEFASLDELGRPWAGGNFDASLFAVQRIRRLLLQRGASEAQSRSLAVIVAGDGTRAYPLTAAEGGNKSMIQTPAQMGRRSLRLVELVVAQYHQILDDIEPGRVHVAAGDHILTWERPPKSAGGQHLQIFANKTSFTAEAQAAGLLDADGRPRWSDEGDLDRRLSALDVPHQLPVLHSLTQMGLLKASPREEDLLHLVEKANVSSILREFTDSGGEARVNWWDWSLSPEAARLLVTHYADLLGTGIDLSMDVLEPVTMERRDWCIRRPGRDPELWNRANALFENPAAPGTRPLGPIGVADPGEGSLFADLGTLRNMHQAFVSALQMTEDGASYRSLLGARLEDGALFVGDRPGPAVSVEPGSIVVEGSGIRSGTIGAGSIVVGTTAGELRTDGRCIVYGVKAPGRGVRVADGEVATDVVHRGRRQTVRGSLFGLPKNKVDPTVWTEPQHGNAMSFSDLHAELTTLRAAPDPQPDWRESSTPKSPPRPSPWKGLRRTRRRPVSS